MPHKPRSFTKKSEPSWGVVSVSRQQHTPKKVFDSDIDHLSSISIKISTAYISENEGEPTRGHVMDDECLVEVRMSEVQFARLITTMNYGVGTPCTLEYIRTGPLQQIRHEHQTTTRDKFNSELKSKSRKISHEIFSDLVLKDLSTVSFRRQALISFRR